MRTSILTAALLGMFAAACTGSIDDVGGGGGGGGDDVGGPACGDGVQDSGEACDDGNTLNGDGCSSTCATESVPRVSVSVDKPSVTTDLLVKNEVSITVSSLDGFAGDVTLAAAVVDAANAPITGWTTALDTTTLALSAGGSGTAKLTLRIPGDTPSLNGSIKISATSSASPQEAAVAVTANPVVVVPYATNGNNCVYPTDFPIANPIRIKVGRMLRVLNTSNNLRMQIHFDGGGIAGIAHQPAPMNAGASYDQTPTGPNSQQVTFYCHDANLNDVAVEAAGQTTLRQRLIAVP